MKTYTTHKKSRQKMFREVVFRHGGTFRFAKISGQTEADVYNRLPCDAREPNQFAEKQTPALVIVGRAGA